MSSYAPGYKGPMSIGGGQPMQPMTQRPYSGGQPQQPMTQPPMGGFGQPLPGGQPMQGGYQKQTFPGGQFGGQPQGGFNPQQMEQQYNSQMRTMMDKTLQQYGGDQSNPAYQAAMQAQDHQLRTQMAQQFGGQRPYDGGPGFDMTGGQPLTQQQIDEKARMSQQIAARYPSFGALQQSGQSPMGGPMPIEQQLALGQSGLRPNVPSQQNPMRQDRNADDPQRQPIMQQPQRQGGPRGRTMPQAPTTQQIGQENPRMAAMRRMQQMRFFGSR